MTEIRLNRSGLHIEGAVRARGDVVDVAPDVAAYLVPAGQAELVGTEPARPRPAGRTSSPRKKDA